MNGVAWKPKIKEIHSFFGGNSQISAIIFLMDLKNQHSEHLRTF
jgi:hypothetical protein